jgi:hypothetical protein
MRQKKGSETCNSGSSLFLYLASTFCQFVVCDSRDSDDTVEFVDEPRVDQIRLMESALSHNDPIGLTHLSSLSIDAMIWVG